MHHHTWLSLGLVGLIFLLQSWTAHAGSRGWQPPILGYHDEVPAEGFPAVASNSTSNLQKRWLRLDPGANGALPRLWPGKTITFAFRTQAVGEAYAEWLIEATKLWNMAGLKAHGFKWKKISFKNCNKDRQNCLIIDETGGSTLWSTVGIPRVDKNANPPIHGPTMLLSKKRLQGERNPVAAIAHELGHVLGLYHEHQNPKFWSGIPIEFGGDNADIFRPLRNFDCHNLVGYDEARARVQADVDANKVDPRYLDWLCRAGPIAQKYDFNAADFLPLTQHYTPSDESLAPNPQVDWRSIMIYSSQVGAKPGTQVLTRPDGSAIQQNDAPSEQDIQGLLSLYTIPPPSTGLLPNNPGSPRSSRFRNIFSNSHGCQIQ